MSNHVRYMYIRNANWEPIGCVAITLNRSRNRLEYGLSMRNPLDAKDTHGKKLPFNRQTAQLLARTDLEKGGKRAFITSDANMHEVTMAVFMDIVARAEAPSGAVRFAKRWLQTVRYIY